MEPYRDRQRGYKRSPASGGYREAAKRVRREDLTITDVSAFDFVNSANQYDSITLTNVTCPDWPGLAQLQQLHTLICINSTIARIPVDLTNLDRLQRIDVHCMSDNAVSISGLVALRVLTFKCSCTVMLSNLPALQMLDIDGATIQVGLPEFPSAVAIAFRRTRFLVDPCFALSTRVETVTLEACMMPVAAFPASVRHVSLAYCNVDHTTMPLCRLKSLVLKGNTGNAIPAFVADDLEMLTIIRCVFMDNTIPEFPNLCELHLEGVTEYPAWISTLQKLWKVTWGSADVVTCAHPLPASVTELCIDGLTLNHRGDLAQLVNPGLRTLSMQRVLIHDDDNSRYNLDGFPRLVTLRTDDTDMAMLTYDPTFDSLRNLEHLSTGCVLLSRLRLSFMPRLQTILVENATLLKSVAALNVLHQLTSFTVTHSAITFPDDTFQYIQLLCSIDLRSSTLLQKLPTSIAALPCLERLNVSLCSMLRELQPIPRLEFLDASSCPLLRTCSLAGMTRLTSAIFSHCPEFLPLTSAAGLGRLKTLLLNGCPKVNFLPPMKDCVQLEILDMSGTYGGAEYELPCLLRLRRLDLSNSHVSDIPDAITRLTQLEHLNLNHCYKLESIVPDLSSMVSLRIFTMCHAAAGMFGPALFSLIMPPSLQVFDATGCFHMTAVTLPDTMTHINITDTCITQLPVHNMRNLQQLNTANSNLTSLGPFHPTNTIASVSVNCTELVRLDCTGLQKCTDLTISSPLLTSIVGISDAVMCNTLVISSCTVLTHVPKGIVYLVNLVMFTLQLCPCISRLPEIFGYMRLLLACNVIDCTLLEALPSSIGYAAALTSLVVTQCPQLRALPRSIGHLAAAQLTITDCNAIAEPTQAIVAMGSDRIKEYFRTKYPLTEEWTRDCDFMDNGIRAAMRAVIMRIYREDPMYHHDEMIEQTFGSFTRQDAMDIHNAGLPRDDSDED